MIHEEDPTVAPGQSDGDQPGDGASQVPATADVGTVISDAAVDDAPNADVLPSNADDKAPKAEAKAPKPSTSGLLQRLTPYAELQPWHRIARDELGVRETPGRVHNDRILEYHRHTTLKATEDEVPWCSSAMCFVMDQAGYQSSRSAAAKSWLDVGDEIPGPRVGCLVIFRRKGGHHVGICEGFDDTVILTLGGNQKDRFGIDPYKRKDVVGYRWPKVRNNIK